MPNVQPRGAAVLSASPDEHQQALFTFARGLCDNGTTVLITYQGLHAALLDDDELLNDDEMGWPSHERYQIREIVHAHAERLARSGIRIGAIIPHLTLEDVVDADYELSVSRLEAEKLEVTSWGVYRQLHTGFLVPDGRVIPLNL